MATDRRGVTCPVCGERPLPYASWALHPGPVIRCRNCQSSLRLVAFWESMGVQVVLTLALVAVCYALGHPYWSFLVFIPASVFYNFVYGWYAARYEDVSDAS